MSASDAAIFIMRMSYRELDQVADAAIAANADLHMSSCYIHLSLERPIIRNSASAVNFVVFLLLRKFV